MKRCFCLLFEETSFIREIYSKYSFVSKRIFIRLGSVAIFTVLVVEGFNSGVRVWVESLMC